MFWWAVNQWSVPIRVLPSTAKPSWNNFRSVEDAKAVNHKLGTLMEKKKYFWKSVTFNRSRTTVDKAEHERRHFDVTGLFSIYLWRGTREKYPSGWRHRNSCWYFSLILSFNGLGDPFLSWWCGLFFKSSDLRANRLDWQKSSWGKIKLNYFLADLRNKDYSSCYLQTRINFVLQVI